MYDILQVLLEITTISLNMQTSQSRPDQSSSWPQTSDGREISESLTYDNQPLVLYVHIPSVRPGRINRICIKNNNNEQVFLFRCLLLPTMSFGVYLLLTEYVSTFVGGVICS
jgi:hypothetical protein